MIFADWLELLDELGRSLAERTGTPGPAFTRKATDDHQRSPPPDYREAAKDLVNVYVYDIDDLRAAADACDEVIQWNEEGTVNRDVIERLEAIDETLNASLRTITVYQCVVAGLGFLTLAVVQIMPLDAEDERGRDAAGNRHAAAATGRPGLSPGGGGLPAGRGWRDGGRGRRRSARRRPRRLRGSPVASGAPSSGAP